jgi:hypothetical protein
MKRSQEQHMTQQQVHAIQSKVMEVTQKLQPVQDAACLLFEEIEGRGEELEQVVTLVEQRLEGPVNEAVIQEFSSRRPWRSSRSKQLEPSLRHLRQSYLEQSDSG